MHGRHTACWFVKSSLTQWRWGSSRRLFTPSRDHDSDSSLVVVGVQTLTMWLPRFVALALWIETVPGLINSMHSTFALRTQQNFTTAYHAWVFVKISLFEKFNYWKRGLLLKLKTQSQQKYMKTGSCEIYYLKEAVIYIAPSVVNVCPSPLASNWYICLLVSMVVIGDGLR